MRPEKEIPLFELDEALIQQLTAETSDRFYQAYQMKVKKERTDALNAIVEEAVAKYVEIEEPACTKVQLTRIFEKIQRDVVKKLLLEGKRPDGRKYDEIRPIVCEVGVLPRSHG